VKNKPIHPPPALSLREQGGLEAGDFSAILVKLATQYLGILPSLTL
ncbi:hypothetical protein JOC49_000327, partial [Fusibacter tunisiensis]|nr:hypothetical protein [Fusibacter tunisiensis]